MSTLQSPHPNPNMDSTADSVFTCGELLVQWLEYYGIDTVFGIPGVHTVELYRGLPNTSIQHITPRHEQGAGFMADGYYRASGKIAVCFIITGPGMTNIMTAMAQALADSIPMLVISSVNKIANTGSGEGHLHELHDQQGMIDKVSLYSKTIWKPESLPKVIAEAFATMRGGRPGPVHLQLPIDVITADASQISKPPSSEVKDRNQYNSQSVRSSLPQPNHNQLDAAVELLRTAQNPVLLYGGGCTSVNEDAQKLSELLDIPTMLTINAKGLLPPAHPLSLGSTQSLPASRKFLADADVILAIGTELGETDYDVVFDDGFKINGRLIRIDCDPRQLHIPFVADIAILSESQPAITGLCERLSNLSSSERKAFLSKRIETGKVVVDQIKNQLQHQIPQSYVKQIGMLKLIRDTLDEVIIVGDSTQPVYSGNVGYEAQKPRKWFNSSTGFGTLGYGLPAAIGAKIATRTPVVSLIGDGGIQFTIAELICAAELNLPLIVLIWNNQGYGEIRRYMQERDLPLIGVNIKTPNFKALSEGFGANYRRITGIEQLRNALLEDSKGNQPVVYEVDESDAFLDEFTKSFSYFS